MTCTTCGKPLPDGETVCPSCGAAVTQTPSEAKAAPARPSKAPRKPAKARLVSAVLAVLAVIAVTVLLLSGKSYTTALDAYAKGYEEGDLDAVLSAYPDFFLNAMAADEATDRELRASLGDDVSAAPARFGENFRVTYKVGKEVRASSSELDELTEDLSKELAPTLQLHGKVFNKESFKKSITDARLARVDITFSGSSDSETRSDQLVLFLKENGEWKIFPGDVNTPFVLNNQ